jgi:hypothetical protein
MSFALKALPRLMEDGEQSRVKEEITPFSSPVLALRTPVEGKPK